MAKKTLTIKGYLSRDASGALFDLWEDKPIKFYRSWFEGKNDADALQRLCPDKWKQLCRHNRELIPRHGQCIPITVDIRRRVVKKAKRST